jgi:hypothetical protein
VCNTGIANASSSVTTVIQIVSVLFIFPPWKLVCVMYAGPKAIIFEPQLEALITTWKASSVTFAWLTVQGFARLNFKTVSCV